MFSCLAEQKLPSEEHELFPRNTSSISRASSNGIGKVFEGNVLRLSQDRILSHSETEESHVIPNSSNGYVQNKI